MKTRFARGLDIYEREEALTELVNSLRILKVDIKIGDADEIADGLERVDWLAHDCIIGDGESAADYITKAMQNGTAPDALLDLIESAIAAAQIAKEDVNDMCDARDAWEDRQSDIAWRRDCTMLV